MRKGQSYVYYKAYQQITACVKCSDRARAAKRSLPQAVWTSVQTFKTT